MNFISPSNRDVTQGHRHGARTRSLSPDTLAKLIESSPDAMLATDGHGEIVWTNAQIEEMFGYTGDELLGHSVERLVPERFREILPVYQRAFAVEPGILRADEGLKLTGRRKDGADFPIEITLSLIRDVGDHATVLAVIRDVSMPLRPEKALPECKEWFRAVLDNSPNLIFLYSRSDNASDEECFAKRDRTETAHEYDHNARRMQPCRELIDLRNHSLSRRKE